MERAAGAGNPHSDGALKCEAIGCVSPGRRVNTRRGFKRACPSHERVLAEAGELLPLPPPLVRLVVQAASTPAPGDPMPVCLLCDDPAKTRGLLCRFDYGRIYARTKTAGLDITKMSNDELRAFALASGLGCPAPTDEEPIAIEPVPAALTLAENVEVIGVAIATLAKGLDGLTLPSLLNPEATLAEISARVGVSWTNADIVWRVEDLVSAERQLAVLVEALGLKGLDADQVLVRVRELVIGQELSESVPKQEAPRARDADDAALHQDLVEVWGCPVSRLTVRGWRDDETQEVLDWIRDGANTDHIPGPLMEGVAALACDWWTAVNRRRGELELTSKAMAMAELAIVDASVVLASRVSEHNTADGIELRQHGCVVLTISEEAPAWLKRGALDLIAQGVYTSRQVIETHITNQWASSVYRDFEAALDVGGESPR